MNDYTDEQIELVKTLTNEDAEELWRTGDDKRYYAYRDCLCSLRGHNHTFSIPQLQFIYSKRFHWKGPNK